MKKVNNVLTNVIMNTSSTVKKIAFVAAITAGELVSTSIGFCDVDLNSMMSKILGVLATVFLYIGILLLCWGIGQLVLAFKNEDADSKSRAIMMIVGSVFLIGIKTFLNMVLQQTGTGVTVDDSGWGG